MLQPSHPICHMHLGITLPALGMILYIYLGNTIVLTASTQKNSIESLLARPNKQRSLLVLRVGNFTSRSGRSSLAGSNHSKVIRNAVKTPMKLYFGTGIPSQLPLSRMHYGHLRRQVTS